MTDRVIMGANWYVDTLNCRKFLESAQLPDLRKAMETFTAGGSFFQLEVPMEIQPLTSTITVRGSHEDIRKLFGREPGDYTTFYYYERLRDIIAGKNIGRVVSLKGLVNGVQPPRVTGKRADVTTYTIGSIIAYKDTTDGNIIHQMDYDTNTLIIDGQDYSVEANRLIAA